ncbi:MAG: exodeoxyribonuclease VII large subunit [Bdellovibrionales bacterium]
MTGFSNSLSPSQIEQNSVLSVEQLNLTIKQLLEGQIATVWVQGEISNFKAHTSGHYYFSLKDAKSQISAVMFRGNNSRLKFKPTDGMEVVARGRISVYEPRGSYQILCETMEPVGAGALQKAFEQLKMKLKSEGLFDSVRKKPIPAFPHHVAIVTSPTGAAIRDILNILSRRAPQVEVTLVPALVQGETAAPSLREAFKKALKLPKIDTIIIGRGGGSIEDMWCFNDEELARLISASSVPVISAVGHEIDFTICDFVSDLRAPTPSAAAELVAKSHAETLQRIESLRRSLIISISQRLRRAFDQVAALKRLLIDPKKRLQDLFLRNDDLHDRLTRAWQNWLKNKSMHVELLKQKLRSPESILSEKRSSLLHLYFRLGQSWTSSLKNKKYQLHEQMKVLNSLSPLQVVDRGYSILMHEGKVVKTYNDVKVGDLVSAGVVEGQIEMTVVKTSKESLWISKKS